MIKFLTFIFDGAILAPIWIEEMVCKSKTSLDDENYLSNQYYFVQMFLLANLGFPCAIICGILKKIYKLNYEPTIVGLFIFVIVFLLSRIIKKKLQRRRFIEKIKEDYITYSVEYKRKKIAIWIIKLLAMACIGFFYIGIASCFFECFL